MNFEIAERLYDYRQSAKLSQEQVAAKVGVSRQAVSKWECGESLPDTDNLIALAALYGVTIDELLFADPKQADGEERPDGVGETATTDDDAEGATGDSDGAVQDAADADAGGDPSAEDEEGTRQRPSQGGTDPDGDYVDISFERGVHVRDRKSGDNVHVSWDGIHVDNDKEQKHVHLGLKGLAKMIREFYKEDQA